MASILLVTNDFGPRAGGIETFVIGLLERIPAGEVIVYTSNQEECSEYDAKWRQEHKVEVIRDRSKILLPTPRVIRNLQSIIKERNLKTIWFGAAAPLAFASRSLRKVGAEKIVAITHGHEVWWSKIWPFSWAMREIANQVDYATFLGEFTKSALQVNFKNKDKLVKIAPGIDTEHFKPISALELRKEFNLQTRPTIISVGRLVHRKGQDRLVEAMSKIISQVPDAVLVFIGEGPHRKALERLVKKHSLENHVIFIGRISYSELPKYICMGDIFAMPSRSRFFGLEVEGLGIVYLEASACGLPVIAGASGGAPDAVIQGETGFVVDGTDVNQIAEACNSLLSSVELRTKLGNNGRRWAEENWRWEIWSKEFNRLLGLGK